MIELLPLLLPRRISRLGKHAVSRVRLFLFLLCFPVAVIGDFTDCLLDVAGMHTLIGMQYCHLVHHAAMTTVAVYELVLLGQAHQRAIASGPTWLFDEGIVMHVRLTVHPFSALVAVWTCMKCVCLATMILLHWYASFGMQLWLLAPVSTTAFCTLGCVTFFS